VTDQPEQRQPQKQTSGDALAALKAVGLVTLGLFALFFLVYGVVFSKTSSFVVSLSRNFYWINSDIAATVAFLVSALIAWPILRSLFRAMINSADGLDFGIIVSVVFASLLASYLNRHKYFPVGADPLFICAPAHPDDVASLEHKGEGESEGRRCIRLTPENTPVARSLEKKRAPKLIEIQNAEQMSEITWLRNGAPAIYVGSIVDSFGMPKLFDGPGFDPDSPDFLVPVTVKLVNELRAKQREKDAQLAESRAQLKERKEREEREQQAAASAKAEREKAEQVRRDQEQRDAELRREDEQRRAAAKALEKVTWKNSELEVVSGNWSYSGSDATINIRIRNITQHFLGLKLVPRTSGIFYVGAEGAIQNKCGGTYTILLRGLPWEERERSAWVKAGESYDFVLAGAKLKGNACGLQQVSFLLDVRYENGQDTRAGVTVGLAD
jgi:hypothetical protein